ncbi:MAG: hypothetical protein CMF51_02270 [Legionellales bacterium]|nr:hypothetical protein [Legionellales bacterium]
MSSMHISKDDINSVRVFVGVVAVLSLTTLPAAMCFPRRSRGDEDDGFDDGEEEVVRFTHPGVKKNEEQKFTLETSDSSSEENADPTDKTQSESHDTNTNKIKAVCV